MKKITLVFALIFVLFLSGCEPKKPLEKEQEIIEILPDDLITMGTLDSYMDRVDVQYVDLRNFEAKFRSGYIKGFESIPFFDYLDNRAFNRNNSYEFDVDQIEDEQYLRNIFDEEKAIFLYADGCIRSNYIRDVLLSMGYERVYVLGGYYEYEGVYNVFGDGTFNSGSSEYVVLTLLDGTSYHLSVQYDMGRTITSIRIDILDSDEQSYRFKDSLEFDYDLQLTLLEEYIVDDIITIHDLYEAISSDTPNEYSNIPNYSLGYSEELILLFYMIYYK